MCSREGGEVGDKFRAKKPRLRRCVRGDKKMKKDPARTPEEPGRIQRLSPGDDRVTVMEGGERKVVLGGKGKPQRKASMVIRGELDVRRIGHVKHH